MLGPLGEQRESETEISSLGLDRSGVFQLLMLLHNAGISVFSICVLARAVQVIY
jgi:hypothetical protein